MPACASWYDSCTTHSGLAVSPRCFEPAVMLRRRGCGRGGAASRGAGIVWGATRRMICGHVWGALRTQAAVLGARSDGMTARAVPRRARAARGGMGCGRGQGCAVVCGASAEHSYMGTRSCPRAGLRSSVDTAQRLAARRVARGDGCSDPPLTLTAARSREQGAEGRERRDALDHGRRGRGGRREVVGHLDPRRVVVERRRAGGEET